VRLTILIGAQDLTCGRVYEVLPQAGGARDRLIGVFVVGDVICNPALHTKAGVWTAIDEGLHDKSRLKKDSTIAFFPEGD
jgi:hypothetical protein